MTQEKYNEYCELIALYKKLDMDELQMQDELNLYIYKAERLLDDEYKYGSSWLDIYYLEKYLNKCEELAKKVGI